MRSLERRRGWRNRSWARTARVTGGGCRGGSRKTPFLPTNRARSPTPANDQTPSASGVTMILSTPKWRIADRVCWGSRSLTTGPVQRSGSDPSRQLYLELLAVSVERLGLGQLHPECV